jgi:hypothetical protein
MSTKVEYEPQELPALAAELLEGVLQQIEFNPVGKPREFLISLHAEKLLRLARDVVFLESNGRSAATPVIARAMLESLFKLGVAAKDPDLAARQTLVEIEWDDIQKEFPGSKPDQLAKTRQKPEYTPIGQSIEDLSMRWGFPEKEYLERKKFSTWKWADKAGMAYLYKGRYAELSNYAHAVSTSFIAPAMPAYVLAVVTMCLLEASERLCKRYDDRVPKDLHDRAAVLRTAFVTYHKSAQYLQLFAKDLVGQTTPRPANPADKFKGN